MAAKAACPAGIRHDALALAMHGFAAYPLGYAKGGNFYAGDIHDVELEKTVDAVGFTTLGTSSSVTPFECLFRVKTHR